MISAEQRPFLEDVFPQSEEEQEEWKKFIDSVHWQRIYRAMLAFTTEAETKLVDIKTDEMSLRYAQGKIAVLGELVQFVEECAHGVKEEEHAETE